MFGFETEVLIWDLLWFLVIVGWVLLIITGLEADKPLSGGLPTHVDESDVHADAHWTAADRLGALVAWLVFGLAAASLPLILWWIFAVHEGAG